jgi:hypothetical protein
MGAIGRPINRREENAEEDEEGKDEEPMGLSNDIQLRLSRLTIRGSLSTWKIPSSVGHFIPEPAHQFIPLFLVSSLRPRYCAGLTSEPPRTTALRGQTTTPAPQFYIPLSLASFNWIRFCAKFFMASSAQSLGLVSVPSIHLAHECPKSLVAPTWDGRCAGFLGEALFRPVVDHP